MLLPGEIEYLASLDRSGLQQPATDKSRTLERGNIERLELFLLPLRFPPGWLPLARPETGDPALVRTDKESPVGYRKAINTAFYRARPDLLAVACTESGHLVYSSGENRIAGKDHGQRILTRGSPLALLVFTIHRRQRVIAQHIGRITGNDHLVAILEGGDLAAALLVAAGDPARLIARSMQDIGIIGKENEATTTTLQRTEPGSIRPAKKKGRHPALGGDESTAGCEQGALESQPPVLLQETSPGRRLAGTRADRADIGILPWQ